MVSKFQVAASRLSCNRPDLNPSKLNSPQIMHFSIKYRIGISRLLSQAITRYASNALACLPLFSGQADDNWQLSNRMMLLSPRSKSVSHISVISPFLLAFAVHIHQW
jgi:hypothetical protein